MNEPPALPPPADPAPPPSENPDPAPPHWQRLAPLIPVLYLVGFVILAGAIIWLWRNPSLPERPAVDPAEVAALSQRVQALEQRPTPRPPDLRPLENRIAALEKRTPPDLAPIEAKLAALQQRQTPDLAPLEARIAALEQRPQVPGDVATKGDLASLASRIDAVAGREDQLANRQQGLETNLGNKLDTVDQRLGKLEQDAAGLSGLAGKVDAIDKRLATVEHEAGQIAALADKAGRIGRIQAAQTALDSGQALGELPGAPASLTRFAHSRPPTEAALRLSFPKAARAAEEASRPSTEGQPFLDRMWTRAQDLVTVREGDHVIVGDPASGIIARARSALQAGDLAGAVSALDALTGPAAQAIADWKSQAQALLDARAALAALAARS
jgi:hypothetical protein